MTALQLLAIVLSMEFLVFLSCSAALPSLKLHFDIKRHSMAVRGATTFDVVVTPVVSGDTVSFNGKVTIEQDSIIHNVLLVDNMPYHQVIEGATSVTTCQATEFIPSVSEVIDAIIAASPVSQVSTDQDISCNGTWLSTAFKGEQYVLCTHDNDENFTVNGADLSVSFEYIPEIAMTKPTNAPPNCKAVPDMSIALSSLDKIYGKRVDECLRRGLDQHRLGVRHAPAKIKDHAPCCSSFSFAILNTVDYEWYNSTLLGKVCDAAMNISNSESKINDMIIVAHSMGNNMFAAALAKDKCLIGKNVDWIDLSGPMKGSMGSDFMHEICDGDSRGSPDVWSKLGSLIGQCPGSITRRSLVYDGGKFCDRKMAHRYAAARKMHEKYVTASMCGTTYNGLFSKEYAGLLAGGLIIPHHSSVNDGVVEFQSCVGNLEPSLFKDTYSSNWYAAKLNHADTTFHDGEGLFSEAQKPLKWFECLL